MAVSQNNEGEVLQWSNETMVQVFDTEAKLKLLPTANNPDWAKGRSIAVLVGGAEVFDQAIKLYAWDADSTTADNGTTVIQPTAIEVDATLNSTGRGRWRSP
jgi:hypothetical protein